jgi:hypothetical protein
VCAAIGLSSLIAPRSAITYYSMPHTLFILGDGHITYSGTFGPTPELHAQLSISSPWTLNGWRFRNIAYWSDNSWWDQAIGLPTFRYRSPDHRPPYLNLWSVDVWIFPTSCRSASPP